MTKDSTFDWFSLDRKCLVDMLYSIKTRVVDQSFTVDQLHNKLVYQIRQHIPIRFKKVRNTKIDKDWIWVGGAYYSDKDEQFQKSIEINFCYSSKYDTIKITNRKFIRLCVTFADTILHEIIHMRQHRRRNWKSTPDFPSTANRIKRREEQGYLGCRDEVDAYSFNIACELRDRFNGNQKKAFKYLNEQQQNQRQKNNCYRMYLDAFNHDHNHPVIKQLKKKVVSYWPQTKAGKPYRNSEWINY
jgi:hypothetical protein